MASLKRTAQTGTIESSDIMITLAPGDEGAGIQIELTSPVLRQFGRQIKAVIQSAIKEAGIEDALVVANDKGALDCTIRARVRAAVLRAIREEG